MDILTVCQHIGNAVQAYMEYEEDQITLWNQKFDIPSDERVYVSFRLVSDKVMSSNKYWDYENEQEIVVSRHASLIGLRVFSKDTQAMIDKDKIIRALRSQGAQEYQKKYGFMIAQVPNLTNVINEPEGSAIPYSFNIPVMIHYSGKEQKDVAYYDTFEDTEINLES